MYYSTSQEQDLKTLNGMKFFVIAFAIFCIIMFLNGFSAIAEMEDIPETYNGTFEIIKMDASTDNSSAIYTLVAENEDYNILCYASEKEYAIFEEGDIIDATIIKRGTSLIFNYGNNELEVSRFNYYPKSISKN